MNYAVEYSIEWFRTQGTESTANGKLPKSSAETHVAYGFLKTRH